MRIEAPEKIIVDKDADQVSCDGGNGILGHPVVFYSFGEKESVRCGYCDRVFVRKA